jgi:DNA polymerase/3'-5' exonuclease PolX
MTNKQIANAFSDLADIMELHSENPFKISSYRNAYVTLRKQDMPISEMSRKDLDAIKGVGKAIGDKIEELLLTGKLETYQKYAEKTPPGVIDMMNINGFGPKKVFQVWQSLGVESVGELLYACNENRLIELKGFGKKTQEEVRKNAEYFLRSKKSQLWVNVKAEAREVEAHIKKIIPNVSVDEVGALRRWCPTLEAIDLLITIDNGQQTTDNRLLDNGQQATNPSSVVRSQSSIDAIFDNENLILTEKKDGGVYVCKNKTDFPVHIYVRTGRTRFKIISLHGFPRIFKIFCGKFCRKRFSQFGNRRRNL